MLRAVCGARWSLIVAVSVLVVFARSASAQSTPLTIEADVITYDAIQQVVTAQGNVRTSFRRYRLFADAARFDLRTGIVTASGRIRLVDPQGQELRGRALTYNTRTEEGVLEDAEGVVERRVYVRGSRLDVAPGRFVAHESTVTTCDPARPLYRITARRIEVVPNQELVAHHASLFLGNRRLFTVPRYAVSLRPTGERTQLPGIGTNAVDGLWVDYRLPVLFGSGEGQIHLKYGAQSGPMVLLTLTFQQPAFTTRLRLGRTQTVDDRQIYNLLRYDVAEVNATRSVRIGTTAFSWTASATAGWYSEQISGVTTSRLDGEVAIASDPIPVGSLTLTTRGALRVSGYGTGALRTVTTLTASLATNLDPHTTASLGYSLVEVRGSTPLTIDVVDPASTVSLGVVRAVPDRYRVAATVSVNTAIPETRLLASVGLVVTRNVEVGIAVDYNTRLSTFEDIDYTLRWICDCVDVVIRYRQVRREFSVEFGLVGFPERGSPFVPRSPLPPLVPPQP